jgi:protein-S-isoprenylcysteine O-methyltransferase Ste14
VDPRLPYRLALAAVILAVIASGALLSRRYGRPFAPVPRGADGPVMATALAAGGLGFYGSLLAFIVWPPLLAWSSTGLPSTLRWAGLALLAGGAALALWARFTLGTSSTVTGVPAPDGELVTRGPYRRLRHPIYSAGLLMVPGAAAVTDSVFVVGIGLVMLVTLDIRTRTEERLLLARFGDDYRRHMDRTHRWLPRLRSGGDAAAAGAASKRGRGPGR